MEFGKKIFHEIDLFDFTSFFVLDFFKFSGPLCHLECIYTKDCISIVIDSYICRDVRPGWATADGKDSEATIKKYKEIHLMILLNEVFKLKNIGNENFLTREMQKKCLNYNSFFSII